MGVLLPFSRKHELEADHWGLIGQQWQDIIPRKQFLFGNEWKKLVAGQKPPEFLSTHPSEGKRIDQLQKYMPEALKYYKPMAKYRILSYLKKLIKSRFRLKPEFF